MSILQLKCVCLVADGGVFDCVLNSVWLESVLKITTPQLSATRAKKIYRFSLLRHGRRLDTHTIRHTVHLIFRVVPRVVLFFNDKKVTVLLTHLLLKGGFNKRGARGSHPA